jgi:hypothetical protein
MSKVLTGSKGAVKINGVKIAYVGGVDITEENTLTDIDVLDQLEVAELAETGHKVSFTCQVFKVNGQATADLGIAPSNLQDILTQPELTMELFNSVEGIVSYTITGVKWAGGSGTLDARGVWQGRWEFKGRVGRGM